MAYMIDPAAEGGRAILEDPRWEVRCCCGRFGDPWPDGRPLIINDHALQVRHESDRCYPFAEWVR